MPSSPPTFTTSSAPSLPSAPTSPRSPTALAKSLFRRSRSRPQLAPVFVPPPGLALDDDEQQEQQHDCRPKSPSVILSPSTPDFPSVGLPPLPAPPPTELVAAQVLPSRPLSPALRDPHAMEEHLGAPRKREQTPSSRAMDPTLRHSLALLDSRLAEIEQLGFGTAASVARRASYQDLVGAAGGRGGVFEVEEEEEERLASEEGGEEEERRSVRLSQPIMAPFDMATLSVNAKDTSSTSLSSIASGTSSEEDAFDIADFPSIDQLNSSFDLAAPPAPASQRSKRSSDLMAFPVPPALPSIPLRHPSTTAAAAADEAEERVFEQLAELGQRGSVQGLGLFSSTTTGTTVDSIAPSPLLSQTGRSSRSSSRSSRSSFSAKSFDASTLASSAANTSYGQREKGEQASFPAELTTTLPLFAAVAGSSSAAPSPTQRSFPAPLNPLTCNLTSAHPALASPFVEGSSFTTTLSSRPTSLAQRSPMDAIAPSLSPTSRHFAIRSSSLLARVDGSTASHSPASSTGRASPANEVYAPSELLNELDDADVPTWQVSAPAHEPAEEELVELNAATPAQQQQHDHIRIIEPAQPPSPNAYGQLPLPSSPSGTFHTLKRLSSFGLLKKRKSEGVLGQSGAQNQQQRQHSSSGFGSLTKRKSEAALSNLLKSSKGSNSRVAADKENDSPVQPPSAGPNKLTRRSASSPKLSKLFGSPTIPSEPTPPLPTSPSSAALPRSPTSTFSARPRALSFGDGSSDGSEQTTSKAKKRFSMYFNQLGGGGGVVGAKDSNGDVIPPLPPTPKEHLPAKSRAPAGIVIDVAKANELDASRSPMKKVEQSPVPTLEISSTTPMSATGSLLFSPAASPADSNFTPVSPSMSTFSRSAVPLSAKPLPSPFPPVDNALSPTSDSSFGPPTPSSSSPSPAGSVEDMSLAAFLKATDPDQQLIVKRPARTSSFFQPSSVFPAPSSAASFDSRSRSSSRAGAETPASLVPAGEAVWSRPTSPALLDALKSVVAEQREHAFAPQEIVAFPVRIPSAPMPLRASPPSAPTTFEGGDDGDDGDSSGEDDYGEGTVSAASSADEDDDKPLGVVVPGALTAQKSLRISAAKQRRSERKAREKQAQQQKDREMRELALRTATMLRQQQQQQPQPQGLGRSLSGRREDPFELEQTAAMVATPPMSLDGHGDGFVGGPPSRLGKPALSPIASVGTYPSCSTITSLQSQSTGHDSLLPQTDASIERRAFASSGMKRSPSSPLDPMIANSSLTMDSPLLGQAALPAKAVVAPQPQQQQQQQLPPLGRARSGTVTRTPTSSSPPQLSPGAAPPMPTMRPPPTPPHPSTAAPPLGRRPSLHPHSSHSSPNSSPASTPHLARRPSLHPDSHSNGMVRQASSSSNKSGASSGAPLSRSNTLARSRANTTASSPPVEMRVYLDAECSKHLTVQYTEKTLAGDVVAFGKGKGALGKPATPKEALEGGWALFEVWRSMGIERPLREYELIADVVKTWDNESNVLVFRRTPLWPILSSHARLHPTMPRTGPVQLEVKKGKWSKRFLELKDGAISYSKTEKGKDSTTLCQLSNFDVFFVNSSTAEQLKAPKPFVFALKSRLTSAHFEEKSEWVHFLSVKSADEMTSWAKAVLEAGNAVARQREQAVLGTSSTPPTTSSPNFSGPLISPESLASPPVPPVPSLPPSATPVTPAAAIAAAARNLSRPAPPILQQRSQTLPLGVSPAQQQQGLARNKTVVKPSAREWGAMGHEGKHQWVKESERQAKEAKQPLVDLSR
ncbi:hypothetical protein JCM6882_007027 [Rhodosporidiobolus microsporus]